MGFFDRFKPRLDLNPRNPYDQYPHTVKVLMRRDSSVGSERKDWCEANLRYRYTVESDYGDNMFNDIVNRPPHYLFRFQDINDAFQFKIRWA